MHPYEDLNICAQSFKSNPFPIYARMRAESPVCRVILPTKQEAWLVTRYEDVSKLLKDSRFVKNPASILTPGQQALEPKIPGMLAPLTKNMLGLDDPDHARLRRLVLAGFTPRRVERLISRTEALAERLLDRLAGKTEFDLVSDFATPLPVTVISELLGVPEVDHERFARWSHTLTSIPIHSWRMIFSLPDIIRFVMYLHKLVDLKRNEPDDDLVSALVAIESDGDMLSGEELLAMIALLISAGHETTTNFIANGMAILLCHPDTFEQFRAEPQVTNPGIEELLRFAGPVEHSTFRYAKEEIEIAGTIIPQGAIVLGMIASANRDEQQFDQSETINLYRAPNRHLTFGEGGHYCIGAPLARMEARVAFSAILRRFPKLKLAKRIDELPWKEGPILRGLARLPVRN